MNKLQPRVGFSAFPMLASGGKNSALQSTRYRAEPRTRYPLKSGTHKAPLCKGWLL